MKPIISVAIATYNGEIYLNEQLSSIMKQTVKVDEVLINDDCSNDNTIKIAKDFINKNKLKNWKVKVNDKRLGCSSNFFKALKQTTGDIIFIADQDDVWEDNKVELMSSIMFAKKNIFLLSSLSYLINERGDYIYIRGVGGVKINAKYKVDRLYRKPFSFFIGRSNIPGCTMCIRKEVRDFLKTHKEVDLNLSLGHDWYFSIVASLFGDFYHLNNPLIKRRIHENNVSLGRLRKTTVLTTANEKRNATFKQIIDAHKFILDNDVLQSKLTKREKKKIEKIILFFKNRLLFTESKNIFLGFILLFSLGQYYQCAKSLKGAFRLYIADLFYAYNINWKLKNEKGRT